MSPRRRPTDNEAIERLVDQRRAVVGRAVRILETDREVPIEVRPDSLRETVALLTVSLEELKVAEEELLQQNEELLLTRAAMEESTRHYRRLFDEAPLPYLVTDVVGMIRRANHAAAALLRRPAELLEGKPIVSFVPLARRSEFRDAIDRLPLVEAAHDWRTTLLRHGDAPIVVTIDVTLTAGTRAGDELLFWMLRPAAAVSGA